MKKTASKDIGRQKLAEETPKGSERAFGLIVNAVPALAWSARPDGAAEFFNQPYVDYVGLPLNQLQDSGWTAAVHPDDLADLAAAWQTIMSSAKPGEAEARLRRFDGEYRWFLFRASPVRDESGSIIKWLGINTDIEDRKQSEAALHKALDEIKKSEAKLRRVIDAIPTLAWCNLPDGPNEFLSKRWHEYTGLSPDESRGWGWQGAFHPEDLPALMKRWQELLIQGSPARSRHVFAGMMESIGGSSSVSNPSVTTPAKSTGGTAPVQTSMIASRLKRLCDRMSAI